FGRHHALDYISNHIVDGFVFAFKAMGPVIPIAGFFFLGSPEFSGDVLGGGDHPPAFLFDIVEATQEYLPQSALLAALSVLIIGERGYPPGGLGSHRTDGSHLDWWWNPCCLVILNCYSRILRCFSNGSCPEKLYPGHFGACDIDTPCCIGIIVVVRGYGDSGVLKGIICAMLNKKAPLFKELSLAFTYFPFQYLVV